MPRRDVVGFVMIPLVLVFTGWLVNATRLWGAHANVTLPWLCTAIGLSVLILGAVCLVVQAPPSRIPARALFLVAAGTLVVLGVGMVLDAHEYAVRAHWRAGVTDWVGFAVVLSGVFALSRVLPRPGP